MSECLYLCVCVCAVSEISGYCKTKCDSVRSRSGTVSLLNCMDKQPALWQKASSCGWL